MAASFHTQCICVCVRNSHLHPRDGWVDLIKAMCGAQECSSLYWWWKKTKKEGDTVKCFFNKLKGLQEKKMKAKHKVWNINIYMKHFPSLRPTFPQHRKIGYSITDLTPSCHSGGLAFPFGSEFQRLRRKPMTDAVLAAALLRALLSETSSEQEG